MSEEIFKNPGDVIINQLILYSPTQNKFISLNDYLVELTANSNIYSQVMTGSITLTDSKNLIRDFPLIGEEILFVDFRTPTFDANSNFSKLFRVYSITNLSYAKDGSTKVYQLNFSSIEAFKSLHNPMYRSFEGKPEEIITQIYLEYLKTPRNIKISENTPDETPATFSILTETANKLKFVSPGWTPFECINWICGKSLPLNNSSADFLFWETGSGFYFSNTDTIFKNPDAFSIGNYVYSESYINTLPRDEIHKSILAIKSLNIERNFDQLLNNMTGYLANQVLNIDLYNKQYEVVEYDHGNKFNNYYHTESGKAVPLFDITTVRNSLGFMDVNYSHEKLFNDISSNFDVEHKNIFGNRRSNLLELDNFKMNLVIPGRTDVNAGALMNIKVPTGTIVYSDEKNSAENDDLYSGNYLITNLCHKVNPSTHFISMTVTKNSFASNKFKNIDDK